MINPPKRFINRINPPKTDKITEQLGMKIKKFMEEGIPSDFAS